MTKPDPVYVDGRLLRDALKLYLVAYGPEAGTAVMVAAKIRILVDVGLNPNAWLRRWAKRSIADRRQKPHKVLH